jgi:hypothetical protein
MRNGSANASVFPFTDFTMGYKLQVGKLAPIYATGFHAILSQVANVLKGEPLLPGKKIPAALARDRAKRINQTDEEIHSRA